MGTKKPSYSVFISSTYLDNIERRTLVEDAVIRAEMHPVGMEHFTASAKPTVDECERQARECDLYVGIIAHRYGWIPDGKSVSITELEYDAAKGRPRLMFEIDGSIPIDKEKDFDQGSDRWAKQEKLDAFRSKYRNDQMPTPFTETMLGVKVLHALNRWRDEHEGNKPTPINKPDTREASQELDRYRQTADSLHSTLSLAGFKTKLRVPIDLEELYVPLQANVDLRATGDAMFADASDAAERLKSGHGTLDIALIEAFREAAKRKRRGLAILGDPGSGKTTHLKRLLLGCLRQGSEGLGLGADVVPVFLPLRELRDLSEGIDAFIEETLDSPHLKMPEGFGARLLERGRLLLLFDGLDEVSDPKERAKVARWIEQAAQARPTCTAVVTCRFAGYDPDTRLGPEFLELYLRPLTREQSEGFIRNWYRVVETGLAPDPAQGDITAKTRADELIERLKEPGFRSARMVEMTRNPLLLANLCLVHRDRGGLPRGRHQLYDECIEVLLERWREAKALTVNVSAEVGRGILQPAALWLHAEEGRTRASAQALAPVLEPALKAAQWRGADAAAFLRTVRDESGLLTGWGPDHYGFMHLGFQEYLAACELRRQAFEGDKNTVVKDLAIHYGKSWWQEVILMLLAQRNPSLFTPFMREAMHNPRFPEASELLGLILEESPEVAAEPFVAFLQEPPGTDQSHWAGQLAALRVLERLQAEEELKNLTDSLRSHPLPVLRDWVKSRARAVAQPVRMSENGGVELVLIPGGAFLMGSPEDEEGRWEGEDPQHQVTVKPFYLGRYPVTNEEYERFMKAVPKVQEPEYWGNRQFNQAKQPVVGVSWDDALRFAEWVGGRLPTEAEWEYAARAGSTSRYWWGDEVGKNNANCDGCGSQWDSKQPSPVGSFQPNAFGLHDLLGNVWEWVEDCWHENYEGAPSDGSRWGEEHGGNCAQRVIRGGSWGDLPATLRSAYRGGFNPVFRLTDLGFRLVQDI